VAAPVHVETLSRKCGESTLLNGRRDVAVLIVRDSLGICSDAVEIILAMICGGDRRIILAAQVTYVSTAGRMKFFECVFGLWTVWKAGVPRRSLDVSWAEKVRAVGVSGDAYHVGGIRNIVAPLTNSFFYSCV
jgi:hypothetical protein